MLSMKKMIFLTLFLFFIQMSCLAVNFGTYKTETDYGLLDGFKWNFFGREKGQPLVEIKSETKEEQIRIEKEKDKPKQEQDEVQMYRFMLDNTVAF